MDGGNVHFDQHALGTAALGTPELFHAGSSYYSMIARLALVENQIPYRSHPVDIHRRCEHQEPWYVRINPNMTVPTLRLGDCDLTESRDILMLAFGPSARAMDPAARGWLDALYAFPIDALTFSWLMSWNPIARRVLPRKLAGMERALLRKADAEPELAAAYRSRAEVFAGRCTNLAPAGAADRFRALRSRAFGLLDRLEQELAAGSAPLASDRYGPLDVLWTVFLARMEFCRLHRAIDQRPAVAAYYRRLKARPSFHAADVWPRLRLRKLLDLAR